MEFVDTSDFGLPYSIVIEDEDELSRISNALARGLNTLSPPDMELIKLLEDMKK